MQTILIFNRHLLVRQGWLEFLHLQDGLRVIGDTGDPGVAVQLVSTVRPDLALVDIEFTSRQDIHLLSSIRNASPAMSTICISSHFPLAVIPRIRHLGVRGCISKSFSLNNFLKVIHLVAMGGTCFPEQISQHREGKEEDSQGQPDYNSLSQRELQVAACIAEGKTAPQIALELGLSPRTVAVHRYRILRKLKLRNIASLVNIMTNQASEYRHDALFFGTIT